mmetsp:Transcript_30850/g.46811  ORF Transcript_30850/g.46811 Transcript_30850/m.46811 type:complete len:384 (+) Transcript_30850:106-1257(+)
MSKDQAGRVLSESEVKDLRNKAADFLSNLELELEDCSNHANHISWLNGSVSPDGISKRCCYFDRYGFIHVPNFASLAEIQAMKQQMETLTKDWDPAKKTLAFSTDAQKNEEQGSDDYFLESASRVHFFPETSALDSKGSLRKEFLSKKLAALNKSGHAMHIIPGAFRDYTTSDKLKALVRELGWIDPVVPQSMYICKNPEIGGIVYSHQDSTFLFTEPRQSCLGLWLALDEATLTNGCLWVRPKSHFEPVRRQFKRNEEHFTRQVIDDCSNVGRGDLEKPKMVFDQLQNETKIDWEGKLPENSQAPCHGLLDAGFIPIECKPGDLLAFVGELDHLSLENYSSEKRHTFQLHLVEGPDAGVSWSKSNWLQYPKGKRFLSLNNCQ